MNRNLLKQIWNERRSNAFLWMELFVVFVILWYIVDLLVTKESRTSRETAVNLTAAPAKLPAAAG